MIVCVCDRARIKAIVRFFFVFGYVVLVVTFHAFLLEVSNGRPGWPVYLSSGCKLDLHYIRKSTQLVFSLEVVGLVT